MHAHFLQPLKTFYWATRAPFTHIYILLVKYEQWKNMKFKEVLSNTNHSSLFSPHFWLPKLDWRKQVNSNKHTAQKLTLTWQAANPWKNRLSFILLKSDTVESCEWCVGCEVNNSIVILANRNKNEVEGYGFWIIGVKLLKIHAILIRKFLWSREFKAKVDEWSSCTLHVIWNVRDLSFLIFYFRLPVIF